MSLHFFCNDKDEWEITDENSGEVLAIIQGDDDSVLWVEQVIKDLEAERDRIYTLKEALELENGIYKDLQERSRKARQAEADYWGEESEG